MAVQRLSAKLLLKISHMRAAHAESSFADHQLYALINMCERPIANTALEKCPLCLQENQPRHLQTLYRERFYFHVRGA
jgi:hypothetical protein